MLKFSYAGCLGLSVAMWVQFTFEMRVAARNRKKFTIPPFSEVQGNSRLSMLTFLRGLSPVLVMIKSMFVSIFNHFYVRRANNGRITPPF